MDNKILAIIVVAVLAVAAVAAVVFIANSEEQEIGVTYYGNGGTMDDGRTSIVLSNAEAVECPFGNGNRDFINWNTQADGNGTTYEVGDSVKNGMSLYAQWNPEHYSINVTYGGLVGLNFSITDGSGTKNVHTPLLFLDVYVPCIMSLTDGSGWTFNGTDTFTGTIDGKLCDLRITSSGLTGVIFEVNEHGQPTIGFNGVSTSNSLIISILSHR